MKYIIGILSILVIAALVYAFRGNLFSARSDSQESIPDMIRNNPEVIVIDVRTPEEYREKRIPGSILVPDYEIEKGISEVVPNKDAKIVLYCRTGRRSGNSAKILRQMGYKNVYDLGGITNWPYETVSGD